MSTRLCTAAWNIPPLPTPYLMTAKVKLSRSTRSGDIPVDKSKKVADSDRNQEDAVKRQLSKHVEIDTSAVSVTALKNQVELSGDMDNNMAKRLAETIVATEVPDVQNITNNIVAHRDMSQAPADEEKEPKTQVSTP